MKPITPYKLVTPEKKIDESVISRVDKQTPSSRKIRKVTISKDTIVKNEFSLASSEIRSPEVYDNESKFQQTERSLF